MLGTIDKNARMRLGPVDRPIWAFEVIERKRPHCCRGFIWPVRLVHVFWLGPGIRGESDNFSFDRPLGGVPLKGHSAVFPVLTHQITDTPLWRLDFQGR